MSRCGGQLINQLTHSQAHGIKVIHHGLHIIEHREQIPLQLCQLRWTVDINFNIDKCLAPGTLNKRLVAGNQATAVVAHHPDRIALQSKDIQAPAIEGHTQGIHQERHIPLVDIDNSVGAAPAVHFRLRVKCPYPGLGIGWAFGKIKQPIDVGKDLFHRSRKIVGIRVEVHGIDNKIEKLLSPL